ncbi:MAG: hypothetical protein AB1716_06295 [Planctomycetota bacterium]
MGPWTYYSPLALGALLVLALNDALRESLAWLTPWQQWTAVAAVAVGVGLQFQVLLFGAQGAFAQVLPVPWGRSIRGGAAVLAGWLILLASALGWVSGLLVSEEAVTAGVVVGVLGAIALGAAVITYVWSLPAALPDFSAKAR